MEYHTCYPLSRLFHLATLDSTLTSIESIYSEFKFLTSKGISRFRLFLDKSINSFACLGGNANTIWSSFIVISCLCT